MTIPTYADFTTELNHMKAVQGMVLAVGADATQLDTVLATALPAFLSIYPQSPLVRFVDPTAQVVMQGKASSAP